MGRDFAAKAADFLFTTFVEIEAGRPHIADMAARARAARREVGVFTTCHVVCRPTQAEAEDYYEHYAVRMEDTNVFLETHRLLLRLIAEGTIQGLRIDHPDGLRDPARYFRVLQEHCLRALQAEQSDERAFKIAASEAFVFSRL